MTELRRRMFEDMQLRGLSSKTQKCYVDSVKNLARYYGRSPDQLTEEEIRHFFLHLINQKRVAESTFRVYLYGIKFFYETTLKRRWPVLDLVRPSKRKKLPVVLSLGEVQRLLGLIRKPVPRMCLKMIYSCGLRLSEGTHLRVADIDSSRMMVRIRNGKGGKDRYVPLAQRTIDLLRAYWIAGRPRLWLFTARSRQTPVSNTTVQKTFKAALRQSGIQKNASVHTLRHSYATHLLESGVNLRVIQEILGHKSPKTTALYTHLTKKSIDVLHDALNVLMADL